MYEMTNTVGELDNNYRGNFKLNVYQQELSELE
jgi:hypothetical protein